MSRVRFKVSALIFIGISFYFQPATATQSNSSDFKPPAQSDSLSAYIARANSSWNEGESDLQLAVNLLSLVAKEKQETYYSLANRYYFWSLKQADFQKEDQAIKDELQRLKPIVPDSTMDNWDNLFEKEDPELLKEVVIFWRLRDPYISTNINERLIEHWVRIHYAKKNFTKSKQPPYDTDDRGIYYVRLGAPQKIVKKSIDIDQVFDPGSGKIYYFEFGHALRNEIEIWNYPDLGDDFLLLFAKTRGIGSYRIQNNILDLIPANNLRVQLGENGLIKIHTIRDFSQKIAQLGLFEALAPHHRLFHNIYSRMKNTLNSNTFGQSPIGNVIKSPFPTEFASFQLRNYISGAPSSRTNLIPGDGTLAIETKVYRFLSEEQQAQFLIAMQPEPDKENFTNPESIYLNNNVIVYDNQWNQISNLDHPQKITQKESIPPSFYLLEKMRGSYNGYISSELIDNTLNDIYFPGKINQQTSAIVATSGHKKVSFPEPLHDNNSLLISDLVAGTSQALNEEKRIPITPHLQNTYKADENIMIYHEAYNIPEEGYAFEYYFEKHRWLFGNKRVDDKPAITLVNDKVDKKNNQAFSIPLTNLEEGTYDLVVTFKSLGDPQQIADTKRIEIDITDE